MCHSVDRWTDGRGTRSTQSTPSTEKKRKDVGYSEAVSGRGAAHARRRPVRVPLPVAGRRAPQQAGSGGEGGQGAPPSSSHRLPVSGRARPHRAFRQLGPRVHPRQAG